MIFYHRTNASEVILREGFRDRNGLVGAFHAFRRLTAKFEKIIVDVQAANPSSWKR
jgi:hypothetical protein